MSRCFIIPSSYRNKLRKLPKARLPQVQGINLVFGTLMVLSHNVYLKRVQKKPQLDRGDREWLMPSLWYAAPQLPFWESEQLWCSFFKIGKHACVSELFKMMTYKGNCYKHGSIFAPETDVVWLGETLRISFAIEWQPPFWLGNDGSWMRTIEVS